MSNNYGESIQETPAQKSINTVSYATTSQGGSLMARMRALAGRNGQNQSNAQQVVNLSGGRGEYLAVGADALMTKFVEDNGQVTEFFYDRYQELMAVRHPAGNWFTRAKSGEWFATTDEGNYGAYLPYNIQRNRQTGDIEIAGPGEVTVYRLAGKVTVKVVGRRGLS